MSYLASRFIISKKQKHIYLSIFIQHLENNTKIHHNITQRRIIWYLRGSPPPWGYVHQLLFFISVFNQLHHKASKTLLRIGHKICAACQILLPCATTQTLPQILTMTCTQLCKPLIVMQKSLKKSISTQLTSHTSLYLLIDAYISIYTLQKWA